MPDKRTKATELKDQLATVFDPTFLDRAVRQLTRYAQERSKHTSLKRQIETLARTAQQHQYQDTYQKLVALQVNIYEAVLEQIYYKSDAVQRLRSILPEVEAIRDAFERAMQELTSLRPQGFTEIPDLTNFKDYSETQETLLDDFLAKRLSDILNADLIAELRRRGVTPEIFARVFTELAAAQQDGVAVTALHQSKPVTAESYADELATARLQVTKTLSSLPLRQQTIDGFFEQAAVDLRIAQENAGRARWKLKPNVQDNFPELRGLTAPAFIKKAWKDKINAKGEIPPKLISDYDPDLLGAYYAYVSQRKRRGLDEGDAKGLTLRSPKNPARPPAKIVKLKKTLTVK